MIKKTILLLTAIFLSSVLFSTRAYAADELILEYRKTTKINSQSDYPKKKKKTTVSTIENYRIAFGVNYFYVENDTSKLIYDFSDRRLIKLNKKDKTYQETLLAGIIHYRAAELHNRMKLGQILSSSGVSNNPFNIVGIESLFSMCLRSKEAIKEDFNVKKEKKNITFTSGNNVYVEMKLSDTIIPVEKNSMFEKYMMYEASIHPNFRKKIAVFKRAPEKLVYTYDNAPTRKYVVTLDLKKSKIIKGEGKAVPREYTLNIDFGYGKDVLFSNVLAGTLNTKRLSRKDAVGFINQATDSGNYLDAFLCFIEYLLQEGEMLKQEIDRLKPFMRNNKECQLYIMASQEKDHQKAIKLIDSINRKGLKKGYILDIVKGDSYLSMNQNGPARELFFKVLKKNPYITGVYFDLGKTFISRYEMTRTWICWDIARRLKATHPFVRQINQHEMHYINKFPEFFR